MDQTNVENGNTVETLLYKKRINSSVANWKSQLSKKTATEGIILGKGDYEFCKIDGKLVQVVPSKLHKSLKRVISSLESDGLVSSKLNEISVETNSFAMEEATL